MHFDTDLHQRSLNEEFLQTFGEAPPDEVVSLFNQIKNPLFRMTEMYNLIDQLTQELELSLRTNKGPAENYTNYRILPIDYD